MQLVATIFCVGVVGEINKSSGEDMLTDGYQECTTVGSLEEGLC